MNTPNICIIAIHDLFDGKIDIDKLIEIVEKEKDKFNTQLELDYVQ